MAVYAGIIGKLTTTLIVAQLIAIVLAFQSSVMVDVADAHRVLLGGAEVEARVGDRVIRSCTAPAGRCYLHYLPIGTQVRVSARAGGAIGEATATLGPGVNELLVRTH